MSYKQIKHSRYFVPPSTESQHTARNHYEDWQEYHLPMARMHNAGLYEWGVVRGLELGVAPGGKAIDVQPGLAINGDGEWIVLAPDGQADISVSAPNEQGKQIATPFRLITQDHAGQNCYVTIQFSEYLRSNAGVLGKLEQMPWLRLQPVTTYQDNGASIVLGLAQIGADGNVVLKAYDETGALPYSRRLLGERRAALYIQQPQKTDSRVEEAIVGKIGPGDQGGLNITVPAAGDTITLGKEGGGHFAGLDVQSDNVSIHGALSVDGSVGIGTTSPGAKLEVTGGGGTDVDLIVNGRLRSNNNDGGLWVASDRFVGGHSTDQIGFWNNNAWRLTVQSDGKVGIGTTEPQGQLQIVGAAEFDGSTQLRLTNGAKGYGRTNLILTGRAQTFPNSTQVNDGWNFGSAARNSLVFAQNSAKTDDENVGKPGDEQFSLQLEGNSNSLGFLTATLARQPALVIQQNGNVGIGTTSPGKKLTVAASAEHLQLIRSRGETAGGKFVFLELFQDGTPNHEVAEVYPSIRFHHSYRYWQRIEARPDGLHFKTGDPNSDAYVKIFAENMVVSGMILMWSGATTNLPVGWVLCNGKNGTPNLTDRFVVGAGANYPVGAQGGEVSHMLTLNEMPSHNHNNGIFSKLLRVDGQYTMKDWDSTSTEPNLLAWGDIAAAGGNQPHENRPPFYALAYIMKL